MKNGSREKWKNILYIYIHLVVWMWVCNLAFHTFAILRQIDLFFRIWIYLHQFLFDVSRGKKFPVFVLEWYSYVHRHTCRCIYCSSHKHIHIWTMRDQVQTCISSITDIEHFLLSTTQYFTRINQSNVTYVKFELSKN